MIAPTSGLRELLIAPTSGLQELLAAATTHPWRRGLAISGTPPDPDAPLPLSLDPPSPVPPSPPPSLRLCARPPILPFPDLFEGRGRGGGKEEEDKQVGRSHILDCNSARPLASNASISSETQSPTGSSGNGITPLMSPGLSPLRFPANHFLRFPPVPYGRRLFPQGSEGPEGSRPPVDLGAPKSPGLPARGRAAPSTISIKIAPFHRTGPMALPGRAGLARPGGKQI